MPWVKAKSFGVIVGFSAEIIPKRRSFTSGASGAVRKSNINEKKKGKCGFRKKLKYRFHSVKGGNHTVFFGDCFKFFVRTAASV